MVPHSAKLLVEGKQKKRKKLFPSPTPQSSSLLLQVKTKKKKMASFPQPAVDPATDPARPHISKEALPHIIDFLRDEKPSVRHRAVLGLLAQSQLPDGPALLLTMWSTDKKKRVVGELCRLVGDLHDIAPDVLSTLINLSGNDMGLDQMLASPRLTDALSKEKYYFCENKNKLNSSGYFRSPCCMSFFFC